MKRSTKYLKIIVNIISFAAIMFICFYVLPKLIVFFMPFIIAGIIALIANPVVRFLEKRMKIVRKAGTAVVIIIVIALIVFLGYLIIAKIIDEIVSLASAAPELWRRTEQTIRSAMGLYNVYLNKMPASVQNWLNDATDNAGTSLTAWFSGLRTPIADTTSSLAQNVPLVIIGIIMAILASYFFLAERDYLVRLVRRIVPKQVMDRWNIVYGTMKDAVGGYLKAQFKIMGIVYIVLFVGLLILRQDNALLVGLLIALLDFLPFFGTGTVMVPWAIIELFQADYKLAVGLMITWGASQLVRQLVQPKLVGDSIGLDPLPTILLLYVGFRLKGAAGLILAVPVGMIVINLYKAGVFSNFVYSIRILGRDLAGFRRFSDEELRAEGIIEDSESIKAVSDDNDKI